MSLSLDPSLRGLNDCGGCAGLIAQTPATIGNPPGLSAIVRRAGDFGSFKESMLAALSSPNTLLLRALQQEIAGLLNPPPPPGYWPPQTLQTRQDTDFSIALLDAWACVADILTFYQERIANEAYLRTATESISLRLLARLVGYELRPGVAAGVNLAFTLENSDIHGRPYQFTVPAGTKAQSIPAPGEKAQTFETVADIDARSDWNAITPSVTEPLPALGASTSSLWVVGTSTNLKPGDYLLLAPGPGSDTLMTIKKVAPDPVAKTTRLDLTPVVPPAAPPLHEIFVPRKFATFAQGVSTLDLGSYAFMQGISVDIAALEFSIFNAKPAPVPPGVYAFRVRASAYGANAPLYPSLPDTLTGAGKAYPVSWDSPAWTLQDYLTHASDSAHDIYLDSIYPSILPTDSAGGPAGASLAVLLEAGRYTATTVVAADAVARADMVVSAKVSRVNIDPGTDLTGFHVRSVSILASSELLDLAPQPDTSVVSGNQITLSAMSSALQAGQTVTLTGVQAGPVAPGSTVTNAETDGRTMSLTVTDAAGNTEVVVAPPGQTLNESLVIEAAFTDFSRTPPVTTVTFTGSGLSHTYVRSTVIINANVAPATHGETVPETLGGGDATVAFQRFTLRQPPLTYVNAATASGARSTLAVRINGLLWTEVPSLYGHDARERIFITRRNDDGTTSVIFGDGQTGMRTPTGQQNIQAVYRRGIGTVGNVRSGQISLLLTRPQGLKGVTNPEDATGGQDPDPIDAARQNAPVTVRTLDRIVSIQDYADFAMAYAGIGKALATPFWTRRKRAVFLTLAGQNGDPVPADSAAFKNLLAAIAQASDPYVSVVAASYDRLLFRISASLVLDPAVDRKVTVAAVGSALRTAFSFDRRAFGQPVYASEVLQVIQGVPGIVAATLTGLSDFVFSPFGARSDIPLILRRGQIPLVATSLAAALPRFDTGAPTPAQLLLLDPGAPDLEVVS